MVVDASDSKEKDPKSLCNILYTDDTSKLTTSSEVAREHRDIFTLCFRRFDLPRFNDKASIQKFEEEHERLERKIETPVAKIKDRNALKQS